MHTKICHFYTEFVKFGLILTHFKFILGQPGGGEENICFFQGGGGNANVALHRHWH